MVIAVSLPSASGHDSARGVGRAPIAVGRSAADVLPPDRPLRYAYYPGCVARGACGELSLSTAVLARLLGIELVELGSASCCGSGTFKEESQLLEDLSLIHI